MFGFFYFCNYAAAILSYSAKITCTFLWGLMGQFFPREAELIFGPRSNQPTHFIPPATVTSSVIGLMRGAQFQDVCWKYWEGQVLSLPGSFAVRMTLVQVCLGLPWGKNSSESEAEPQEERRVIEEGGERDRPSPSDTVWVSGTGCAWSQA